MIRRAELEDIHAIMNFIDTDWQKGHILAVSEEFFRYQHVIEEEISYIISVDEQSGKVNAVLGYIPYGRHHRDVMLALWKKGDSEDPFLGVQLLQYLQEHEDCRIVACAGINESTFGIYRFMGYYVDEMKHYYRLNPDVEYHIAKIVDSSRIENTDAEQYDIDLLRSYEEFQDNFDYEGYRAGDPRPYKEVQYIQRRYFQHPVYDYKVLAIQSGTEQYQTILFAREVSVENRKILRIVDIIGKTENLAHIMKAMDALIKNHEYEYVDFYQWGIPEEIMTAAGFSLKTEDGTIIPNYFEPFVRENIHINFSTQEKEHFIICKGDGDMDRPNRYIRKE